jgi:hypothetical protein
MSDVKPLYNEDLLAWSKQQAEALRSAARGGSNQTLDWENLAEEIEDLGASQKSSLHSQLRRIIKHLLKLENSPAGGPRGGWVGSICDARGEIEYLLEVSPSLRRELEIGIAAETKRATKAAIRELDNYGEADHATTERICATTYTEEHILGDWFPSKPPA